MSGRRGRGGGRAQQQAEEEDEDASQSSQAIRSSGVMDPGQDLSDRRKIRRSYRELIQQTNDQKQEYIRPESNGLFEALARGDSLYKEVRMPREAALDSEFLQVASQLGLEQTRRLHTGFKTYEVNDFVSRLKTQYAENEEGFNWLELGKKVSPKFNATPAINFMFGPMSVEPPQKKERKKIVREKRGMLTRPEEVQDTQLDSGVETTHRVQDVVKHLAKAKSANYFHFVLNPSSFGQTVENIFHSAFLIRDGLAKLSDDSNGNINFEPTNPPKEEDYNLGKAARKQCIVKFDWKMWEKMKENFQGEEQIIPHRKPGEYMHPGLKNKTNNTDDNDNNHGEGSSQPNGKNHSQKGKRAATKRGRKQEESDEEEENGAESEEEVVQKKRQRSTPHPRGTHTTTTSSSQPNGNGKGSPLLDDDDEYYVADSQQSTANGKQKASSEPEDSQEEEEEEEEDDDGGSSLKDSRLQKRKRM